MSIRKDKIPKIKSLESALDRIHNLRIKQQSESDLERIKNKIQSTSETLLNEAGYLKKKHHSEQD